MECPAQSGFEEAKARLRAEVRQRLRGLSPRAREEAAGRVCERILAAPSWSGARAVLLFAPLADEVDVWPLVGEALRLGKRVALPRFNAHLAAYEPAFVSDATGDLTLGPHGIREPRPDRPAADVAAFDWMLVPGVAFDAAGHRLGRGAGHYDRLLVRARGLKVGVAFAEQLVAVLPVAEHDVRMDLVVTPLGMAGTGA